MKINELFVTVVFLGKINVAPGTIASLATSIFFYFFLQKISVHFLLLIIISISLLALITISKYTKNSAEKDKSEIVIDELIGQLISLTPIIIYKNEISYPLFFIFLSFILFRVFDILKPQPIKFIDQINSSWAVVCDDCLAGFFAALFLTGIIKFLAL